MAQTSPGPADSRYIRGMCGETCHGWSGNTSRLNCCLQYIFAVMSGLHCLISLLSAFFFGPQPCFFYSSESSFTMCPPLGAISGLSTGSKEYPECLPPDDLSRGAYDLARSCLPPAILNHSVRVFRIGERLAKASQSDWAYEKWNLLFVACILHDIGCASQFDGPQRFEVEGADAAANYLHQHKIAGSDVHEVWQAIALHTSPGIAERISVLARLVRQAVLIDFGTQLDQESHSVRDATEEAFPRLGIENILGDVVVDQALRQPQKAPPASWPGVLLRAKRDWPEWEGVNKGF